MKRVNIRMDPTPLYFRLAIVRRHHQKFAFYPSLKAAARELLTGGFKLDGVSVQPLAKGAKRAGLYEFQGVSSPDTRLSWDFGWVKDDAPIIACARVRRCGEEKWLTVPDYRKKYNENELIIGLDNPVEFGTAFWLRQE